MRVLAIVVAVSLATGCVSKGKYTELENNYTAAVADRDQAKADAEKSKNDLQEVREKNRKRLESFMAVYETLLDVESKGLAKVKIDDGRAVLQLDSDILFASGSATLTPKGVETVAALAGALKGGTGKFQVEGHTDSDALKNSKEFPTNWHLGADRSINVVLEMTKAGMPNDRISAATFSQYAPIADNAAADGKKQNRRIEVVWMPELSELLPFKKMMKELKKKDGAEEAKPE